MRYYSWVLRIILMIGLLLGMVGIVFGQDLPTIKGKKTVATVNGEAITLDEFNQELATIHQ